MFIELENWKIFVIRVDMRIESMNSYNNSSFLDVPINYFYIKWKLSFYCYYYYYYYCQMIFFFSICIQLFFMSHFYSVYQSRWILSCSDFSDEGKKEKKNLRFICAQGLPRVDVTGDLWSRPRFPVSFILLPTFLFAKNNFQVKI